MAKIKRDDQVIVLAGKDKGKRGTVRKVLDNGKLVVSGINMIKKHTKPNPQAGIAGGIVEKEAAFKPPTWQFLIQVVARQIALVIVSKKMAKSTRLQIKRRSD